MLKAVVAIVLVVAACAGTALYLSDVNIAVLNPKGWIANEQRELIIIATLLMLIVVLPVFALTAYIAWRYREGNKKGRYDPEWDHSRGLELLWWAVPGVIITILSVITWQSTHALDPFKPLASSQPPMQVQVIATQWRWLFLYPDYSAASLNELRIPTDRPIEFSITSDAPMNSFWIPNLGGQIYAMPGMATKLHLIADETGSYPGQSANISGEGFSNMRFSAIAMNPEDFIVWAATTGNTSPELDWNSYKELAKPNDNESVEYFRAGPEIFEKAIAQYMSPGLRSAGAVYETHAEAHHD